jgi:hypothetical protein
MMGEQSRAQDVGHELPTVEHLVNLTGHSIVLESVSPSAEAERGESPAPSNSSLPAEGSFARVGDRKAGLGEGWLNTGQDLVHLARLRRSNRVQDLPARKPGIRYVVSRLTAQAAWYRDDLVFPFGEIRDPSGRITGARGLAAYRPRWAVRKRLQDWKEARLEQRARRPLVVQWKTGVMFLTATALLSGALGLFPGVLDNARRYGWGGGGQFWATWLTVVFGVGGGLLLLWAALRWRMRETILTARGTAYVIEEQAITWRHEEKASVLATIATEFAAVLRVPGPDALGEAWRWQADAHGAPLWDARTDQLVHSFWAVHYNDDQVTRNAVFTWAPWPVAMALGARATARRRGLVLHVRQRPSYGAHGPRQHLRLTEGAHDFLRDETPPALAAVAPDHTVSEHRARLTVTFSPLVMHNESKPARPGHPRTHERAGPTTGPAAARLLLLVIRVTHGPIGDIDMDLPKTPEIRLNISPGLPGPGLPAGTCSIPAAEWRLDSGTRPVPPVPWKAFPAAAESIADWVVAQSNEHQADVILLATRIPQELAVGLGIQLGQRSHTWPRHVYPVYFAGGRLVVPGLALGADSVQPERS